MKTKTRILFFATLGCSLLLLTGCPGDVTFTFDTGSCTKVALSPAPTATITKGNPPTKAQLTVKVCVVCNDTDPATPVAGGASVALDGFTEFAVPGNIKQLLATPLIYNATSKCYEKTFGIPDTDVLDPQGVLGGKKLNITVKDKAGETVSGASTSVTIQAVP